jgi:hypothetical protein
MQPLYRDFFLRKAAFDTEYSFQDYAKLTL